MLKIINKFLFLLIISIYPTHTLLASSNLCRSIFLVKSATPNPQAAQAVKNMAQRGLLPLKNKTFRQYAEEAGIERKTFIPEDGWLKGHVIEARRFYIGKLAVKHGLSLNQVKRAFEHWHEGPIETPIKYRSPENEYNTRYFFVAKVPIPNYKPPTKKRKRKQRRRNQNQNQIKNKGFNIIKVVFDLTPEENIVLISSYYARNAKYQSFMDRPKVSKY